MRLQYGLAMIALLGMLPIAVLAQTPGGRGRQPAGGGQPPRPAMTLTTTAFPDGGQIPAKYTQAGEQVSPALTWRNVPPGTQSFVLMRKTSPLSGRPDGSWNRTATS
jgi:hypothetical protein